MKPNITRFGIPSERHERERDSGVSGWPRPPAGPLLTGHAPQNKVPKKILRSDDVASQWRKEGRKVKLTARPPVGRYYTASAFLSRL